MKSLRISAVVVVLAIATMARAGTTYTWTNTAGGTWSVPGNWSGGVASGADNTADFSTLNITADAAVTLDALTTIGNLKFADTTASNAWSLTGSTLTLDTTTGAPTITVGPTLAANSATISSILAGNDGLVKDGQGMLTLSGTNSYTGATTISNGTLTVNSAHALDGTSGVTVVGTSGTAESNLNFGAGANGATFTTPIALNGSASGRGNLYVNKANGAATSVTLSGPIDVTSTGTYAMIYASNSTTSLANTLTINGDVTGTMTGGSIFYLRGGPGSNGYLTGAVNIGSAPLIKSDAGTWTLSGANTIGATTISNGTLTVNSAHALDGTSGVTVVGASGTAESNLDFGAGANGATYTAPIALNGKTAGRANLYVNKANGAATSVTLSGPIDVTSSGTYAMIYAGNLTGANTLTIDGDVTGAMTGGSGLYLRGCNGSTGYLKGTVNIGAATLTKGDTGVWIIGNDATPRTNTWGTTVLGNWGALRIAQNDALPITTAVTYNHASAILNLAGYNQTIASISSTASKPGYLPLESGTLTVGDSTNTAFYGAIQDDGNLIKQGTGTLTLYGDNTAFIGNTAVNAGTLALGNQKALQGSTFAGGAGSLVFDSSVIGHAFTFGGLNGSSNLDLRDNAGTPNPVALSVGYNNGNTSCSGALSGSGSVTKIGTGTLTLSGDNSYTGATTVSDGTLKLGGSGDINSTSGVIVDGTDAALLISSSTALTQGVTVTKGTLGGTGTISGPVSLTADSILSPGESIGTLTVGSALALAGTTRMEIDKDPTVSFDLLDLGGNSLTFGGVLQVVGSNMGNYLVGDSFNLFDAAGFAGGFSGVELPTLGAGLQWDTSHLGNDGTLRIGAVPEPNALAILVTGLIGLMAYAWRRRK